MILFLKILLIVLALVLVTLMSIFNYTFRRGKYFDVTREVCRPGSRWAGYRDVIEKGVAFIQSAPCQEYSIPSREGLALYARFFRAEDEKAIILLFHGYRSIAQNDFAGAVGKYLKMGYSVLLPDERAHGRSEGNVISFGALEKFDVLQWSRFMAQEYPGVQQVLEGMSMGASAVLMASDLPLPAEVRGIIGDCGYTCPDKIICKVMRDRHLPRFLHPFVLLSARLFGGFDLKGSDARLSLAKTRLPVLLIHGEGDSFVPCEMSHENFDSCGGKKRLVTVPGAEHGFAFLCDPDGVGKAITEFLNEVCETNEG